MKNITVITGGAGGMGIACAKIKGKTDRLLLVDVSQERLDSTVALLADLGIKDVETAVCDVRSREEVDALAQKAAGMGRIETVLNLAGVSPAQADADLILAVNGVGVYNMIEGFFAVMGEGSNMVTVNSLAVHLFKKYMANADIDALMDAPEDGDLYEKLEGIAKSFAGEGEPIRFKAYPVSKYFSYRYSRRNVRRFWSKGIRINTVTPGTIATPMGIAEAEGNARMQAGMAIDRDGTPDEMAAAICFLTTADAADITGIDLPVDGGWTCIAEFPQIEV